MQLNLGAFLTFFLQLQDATLLDDEDIAQLPLELELY
jgi:hypothetical protein